MRGERLTVDQRTEIEAILGSGVIAPESRQGRLLSYLFSKSCSGEAEEVKEYTIALEVFGKPPTFDPHQDATVRVEAHRLRKKLDQYYERHPPGGGKRRIVLPVGEHVLRLARPEAQPRAWRFRWQTAAVLAVCTGLSALALAWWLRGTTSGAALAKTPLRAVHPSSDPEPGALRILAGYSGEPVIDVSGRRWQPDRYFEGGNSRLLGKRNLARTGRPELFEWAREGTCRYRLPAEPGDYQLRLYFAQPEPHSPAATDRDPERHFRIMTITANGQPLMNAFDLDAVAGHAAEVRDFSPLRVRGKEDLTLEFYSARGPALISGIELLPLRDGRVRTLRISARKTPYVDVEGKYWSPDDFYFGGKTAPYQATVIGAPDPGVFPAERYGDFEYAIPVPEGKYRVTLYFAETWFGSGQYGKGAAGSRSFDVFINHEPVLRAFDLLAQGPPNQLIKRTFEHVTPNQQGKIRVDLVSRTNYATLRGIEVAPE
jgi:hypothetical protein